MARRSTVEGISRGMLLVGPFATNRTRLVTVTRVRGQHAVDVIWEEGGVLAEAGFRTTNINKSDDFHVVRFESYDGKGLKGKLRKVPWGQITPKHGKDKK